MEAPKQRNSREENKQIKEGKEPEDWNSAKRSQKDTDARWTKKGGQDYFGYKNHVCVDSKSKLIKNFRVTAANKRQYFPRYWFERIDKLKACIGLKLDMKSKSRSLPFLAVY